MSPKFSVRYDTQVKNTAKDTKYGWRERASSGVNKGW